jgi:hypothetical protein
MCYGCQTEKDESRFHRETARNDGLATQCKDCRSKHYKRRYVERREHVRVTTAAYKKERRDLIDRAKSVPCMDCGQSYPPYVMDFDHRDGEVKLNEIARMVKGSMASLLAEIAKCDVVCSNCHRERTYQRWLAKQGAVPERQTGLPAKQLIVGSSPTSASGSCPGSTPDSTSKPP